jgi:hypothetical protein
MTPTTALVIITTLVAVRPFFELPDSVAKREALKKAGYQPAVKRGCAYLLMIPVMLGLWWWYALATNQLLLGIIPSIGTAATVLAFAVENAAGKQAAR